MLKYWSRTVWALFWPRHRKHQLWDQYCETATSVPDRKTVSYYIILPFQSQLWFLLHFSLETFLTIWSYNLTLLCLRQEPKILMCMLYTFLCPVCSDFCCVLPFYGTHLWQVGIQDTLKVTTLVKHPRCGTDSNRKQK